MDRHRPAGSQPAATEEDEMKRSSWHARRSAASLLAGMFVVIASRVCPAAAAQPAEPARAYLNFDADWRFSRGDFANAAMPAFNDSAWRRLNVPHDWSAEGPFGPGFGSGNGYAPGGIGWYRKRFGLDAVYKDKIVAIEFDGVYDFAEVWINGHFVGGRPYGYSSFECTLTPYLRFGPADNVIAVRVDHSRFADSRWYTGSGIYRHVRLRVTGPLRIAHWGTFITTPQVRPDSAVVRVETSIENSSGGAREFSLLSEILASDGRVVASKSTAHSLDAGKSGALDQQMTIPDPRLWSVESPVLYMLRSRLSAQGAILDETTIRFGIRTIRYDADKGFLLNERQVKLKGVCLHHDAGCLGAAVPEKVWERRLLALKELGVNAVRTSHNPPAPELLDLCDRLGLLVQDEAFDEFTPSKNKWVSGWNIGVPSRFGYGEVFAEWSDRDIRDMVRRDRNHPSIIMWSIGNEIDYPNDPFSHPALGKQYRPENPAAENLVKCARPLVEAVKALDPTRPVTAALASLLQSDAVGLGELLDVVGYNYQESRYAADRQKYPRRVIYGSENNHQYSNWAVVRDNDYVAGQFLWTGIDYLGESGAWPNRANGAGLLDLCGFKKPLAWFRQSLWSDAPMVYLSAAVGAGARSQGPRAEEHWNWPQGSKVRVFCYTNCTEVRLTVNDRPVGSGRAADAVNGVLSWELPFEQGSLKAVGFKDGKAVSEFALRTAGPAARIQLLPDATDLRAGGHDICHVEFRITDAHGIRVPDAGQPVTFEVTGPAEILGIGNGDLNNSENSTGRAHKAYQGRGLVILEAGTTAGSITLKVSAAGLDTATLTLHSR